MKYNDEEISRRLGFDKLEPAVAEKMLVSFYQALDNRVGHAVVSQLSDEQLAKFETLRAAGDESALDNWLITVIPNYETLLKDETDKMLQEIDDNAADMIKE